MVISVPKFYIMDVFIILCETANIFPLAIDFLIIFMLSVTFLKETQHPFSKELGETPWMVMMWSRKVLTILAVQSQLYCTKPVTLLTFCSLCRKNLLFVKNKNTPVPYTVNPKFAFSMILCTFCMVSVKCP